MIHIGLDVGYEGAVAAVDDNARLLGCQDLEITRMGKFAWTEPLSLLKFIREVRDGKDACGWVEYVAPMPKLSTVSAAGMGRTHGSALAILQMAGIPFEMIAPQTWKRRLNLICEPNATDSERKRKSLDLARIKFPGAECFDRAMDHNRADAALIAYFGRMKWAGDTHLRAAMTAGAAPF